MLTRDGPPTTGELHEWQCLLQRLALNGPELSDWPEIQRLKGFLHWYREEMLVAERGNARDRVSDQTTKDGWLSVSEAEVASILVTADCSLCIQADRKKGLVWLSTIDRFYEEGWDPEALRCLITALEAALGLIT